MSIKQRPNIRESMKQLSDMTLLDNFLFTEAMSDPEIHEAVLQIILGEETIRLIYPPQAEKAIQRAPDLRSIRVDVYALDSHGTVYDTEMQAQARNNLRRRSRYYQSLIDSSLLEPGCIDFNSLNDVCVIMISPFDLFGEGRYIYTFAACCLENKALEMKDGAVRIFLNTRGTNEHDISPELKAFLRYVESTDGEIAENSGSDRLRRIHAGITRIKASEKIGVKYMQRWEEREYDRLDAREEGHAAGLSEGLAAGLSEGHAAGLSEGHAAGLAEGEISATLASLRKLMTKQDLTAEKAMDLLDIPENERGKYRPLL